MKRIIYLMMFFVCYTANAQNVTKKCKTCGKPIAKCQYKGNHPSTPTVIDNSIFLTDYSKVRIGDYFYADGTYSHNLETGKTAIGVVFSTETSESDKALGYSHGYIMALKDAKKGHCSWGLKQKTYQLFPIMIHIEIKKQKF